MGNAIHYLGEGMSSFSLWCKGLTRASAAALYAVVHPRSSEAFTPHGHLPVISDGSGFYGDTLGRITIDITNGVKADILKVVKKQVSPSDTSVYTIADYGCADGAASMALFRDVIALVRQESGAHRPVQVLYEDQHSNDFNSLFRRLHGEIPDPPSYLRQFPDVLTMATATNFYQQCAPDSSLDLCHSSTAVHWLRRPITGIKGSVFCWLNPDPQAREEVSKAAAEDWEVFLLHRAKELKPGGLLVVTTVVDSSNKHLGNNYVAVDFTVALDHVWRKFRDEGIITHEEFENTHVSIFLRTPEECRAPFEDPNSAVGRAGLRLQEMRVVTYACSLMKKWKSTLKQTGEDTREETARKIVNANRTWSSSSILSGLNPERTNKKEVVDELYAGVVQYLLAKPFDQARNDIIEAHLVIKKVAD